MADVVQFPGALVLTGHPLQQIAKVADRCRAVAAVLPVEMQAVALVTAAAAVLSGRASSPAAQSLCLEQTRMIMEAMRNVEQI